MHNYSNYMYIYIYILEDTNYVELSPEIMFLFLISCKRHHGITGASSTFL